MTSVGPKTVGVNFGKNDDPQHHGMVLLVIRDNTIVAKVTVTGFSTRPSGKSEANLSIMYGNPRVGDKVVGIQKERRYKEADP